MAPIIPKNKELYKKSFFILSFLLTFLEVICNKTFLIDSPNKLEGICKILFVNSKYPTSLNENLAKIVKSNKLKDSVLYNCGNK